MRHPFYIAYGVLLIAAVGWGEYRGWGNVSLNELKQVPKTVRDNPGSYRAHYGYVPRYFGGK